MMLAAGGSGAAAPLGLLILLLIGVSTVLLVRNMNGRLRRLPRSFDAPETTPEPDVPDRP